VRLTKWLRGLTELSFDAHFEFGRNIFKGTSISTADLQVFASFAGDVQLSEEYGALCQKIVDEIVVPNGLNAELVDVFEDLAILFERSGVAVRYSPKLEECAGAILNSIGSNEPFWQYRLLRLGFAFKRINGQNFTDDFLKVLMFIPSHLSFQSSDDIFRFKKLIHSIFPDCKSFLNKVERLIFDDSFFDKDLIGRKAAFMWVYEVVWNTVFKEDSDFSYIMPCWFDLFDKALKEGDKEFIFYIHSPLSHVGLNLCQTQDCFKIFNERVEMPLSKYIQKNMRKWGVKPVKKKSMNERKKLGFVYGRIVPNSPCKLLVSLLNYIKAEGVDLYVYDMGYIEKAVSDESMIEEIKELGVNYINAHELIHEEHHLAHYYSHFNKAIRLRDKIIEDDIDILAITGNALHSNFIFSTRTAPLQMFWDHGNHEYDVKNIDKRVIHFNDGYENKFEFEQFELKMLDKYLNEDEQVKIDEAEKIKAGLPEHSVVLGSIGRLMKLSDEYLETVAEILKNNNDAIYLACGSGNIDEKKKKVEELGVSDRFIFTGYVDAHVYGHVIDIYLNTFPLKGGESVNEFLAKGDNKYVVN